MYFVAHNTWWISICVGELHIRGLQSYIHFWNFNGVQTENDNTDKTLIHIPCNERNHNCARQGGIPEKKLETAGIYRKFIQPIAAKCFYIFYWFVALPRECMVPSYNYLLGIAKIFSGFCKYWYPGTLTETVLCLLDTRNSAGIVHNYVWYSKWGANLISSCSQSLLYTV